MVTTSHFNNSTPFNSAVSLVMDIVDPLNGGFVLVLLIFPLQVKYDVSRSSQLGIAFGLFLFLAGSVIGGVMVAQGQSVVGVRFYCTIGNITVGSITLVWPVALP